MWAITIFFSHYCNYIEYWAYDTLCTILCVLMTYYFNWKKLTFCSSASRNSNPGIPLDVPVGPVLTNFSVVVTFVRFGDMGLKNYFHKSEYLFFTFIFYIGIIRVLRALNKAERRVKLSSNSNYFVLSPATLGEHSGRVGSHPIFDLCECSVSTRSGTSRDTRLQILEKCVWKSQTNQFNMSSFTLL